MTTNNQNLDSVIDCMLFTSAAAKYDALVSVSGNMALSDRVSDYTEPERLSKIESQIFGIDIADVPELSWAYERYLNLIGTCTAYFSEFIDEERRDYAQFYRGECEWDFWMAVGFMVTACKLPQPECMAWVCKIVAAEVRGGLYDPPLVSSKPAKETLDGIAPSASSAS